MFSFSSNFVYWVVNFKSCVTDFHRLYFHHVQCFRAFILLTVIGYSYSYLVELLLEYFADVFVTEFENSSYILDISPLSGICFTNNFLLVCAILTHFLNGIFWWECFKFWCGLLCFYVIAFYAPVLKKLPTSKYLCPKQQQQKGRSVNAVDWNKCAA